MLKRSLIILLLVAIFAPGAKAETPYQPRVNRHDNIHACPTHWGRSLYANKRLVKCEAELFHLSVQTAFCVVSHESGFQWWERWSGNSGTYQQRDRYWTGRYSLYAEAGGFYKSILNSRTNTVVSMRLVHDAGWTQWTTYGRYCA